MADPTVFEIPLSPQPQTLRVALGAQTYGLTAKWVAGLAPGWTLDITDATGVPMLSGVPLVTGADLLAQYGSLGIPGSLVVQTDHDTDTPPTFDNLGVTSHLFYVP